MLLLNLMYVMQLVSGICVSIYVSPLEEDQKCVGGAYFLMWNDGSIIF